MTWAPIDAAAVASRCAARTAGSAFGTGARGRVGASELVGAVDIRVAPQRLRIGNGRRVNGNDTGVDWFRRVDGRINAPPELADAAHLLNADAVHEAVIARVRR